MEASNHSAWTLLKYMQAIVLAAVILYVGRIFFVPLLFGLLIAMVMFPICRWFEVRGCGKSLSIIFCLLIVGLLFAAILGLLAWQIRVFSQDAPEIIKRIEGFSREVQDWLTKYFGLPVQLQSNWNERLSGPIVNLIQSTAQSAASTLFMLFLVPVYTALFLYHRHVFVQFLKKIVPGRYQHQLDDILQQTIKTYFNYIKGMVFVYIIVGILNSIGLLALGVKHAILFGMLCAIMTIIPYVGLFFSALLPISVVWMDTGNIWYPLGVIALFGFVQYLEANVIFPKVVGAQLDVSTFSMLAAIILGGIIWGVSGMVLFIPFVAILKIISEHIEEWKPINELIRRD